MEYRGPLPDIEIPDVALYDLLFTVDRGFASKTGWLDIAEQIKRPAPAAPTAR